MCSKMISGIRFMSYQLSHPSRESESLYPVAPSKVVRLMAIDPFASHAVLDLFYLPLHSYSPPFPSRSVPRGADPCSL